ncbi:unnamed protein product, partial [Meganyctiphanes norvegica]
LLTYKTPALSTLEYHGLKRETLPQNSGKITKKPNRRRNTWPEISNKDHLNDLSLSEASISFGNKAKSCFRIKRFFKQMMKQMKAITKVIQNKVSRMMQQIKVIIKVIQNKVSPLMKYLPVFISIAVLALALSDVATDA